LKVQVSVVVLDARASLYYFQRSSTALLYFEKIWNHLTAKR
jgi:hypothetical protein